MKYFLRIAAVLVALGNWCALMTGGDLSRLTSYGWAELLSFVLVPSVLGLAAAEISLRLAAKALRGSFLERYAALAATVWIGGMLCGVALASGGVLRDEALDVVGTIGFGAVASLWGIVCGGVFGLAEGLVLALPLAALLGSLGKNINDYRAPKGTGLCSPPGNPVIRSREAVTRTGGRGGHSHLSAPP